MKTFVRTTAFTLGVLALAVVVSAAGTLTLLYVVGEAWSQ